MKNSNNRKNSANLPIQFWIVTLIAFINSVSFTIILPLLYTYATKQFDLTDFQASLLVTVYAFSQFIGTPILGKLSDRLGRKPLLVISLLGTVLANLIACVAPFAWLLFAARILDGLTGGNNSIATAVISDITSPSQRPKAFGIFDASFRLGFVAGPTLSYFVQLLPPLPGISSLGMSFLVSAVIAFVATLLTIFFLPETISQKQDIPLSWSDFSFSKIAKSATQPKLGSLFVLSFFNGATFTIFTFAFQPFVLFVLNQNAQTLAIIFAIFGILGFTSQVFFVDPLRNKFNLIDILFAAILARGLLFLMIPTFPDITIFFAIVFFFGLVNSFPMPTIGTILSLNTKEKEQGEVLGINASYLSFSNAIGPSISGLLVGLGYKTPFWITGVLTVLTAGFVLSLKSQFVCKKNSRL